MDRLACTLLYGGLAPEQFEAIRDSVTETNRKNLLYYTLIGSVAFLGLFVASRFTQQGPPTKNGMIYLLSCLAMGAMASYLYHMVGDKPGSHARVVSVLTHVFMITLHAFSLSLSIAHPEYPAVSAIVFLLVNPLLFVVKPTRIMLMTSVAIVAICVSSVLLKDPGLAVDDQWNATTFGMVALVVDVITMRAKFTQLNQVREIAYLSSTDTLTQLRNRNHYEKRLDSYADLGTQSLVCVYIDANDLRELNNSQGHDAGDELLRAIARQMRERFGDQDTYRIGGDEFVAIIPDGAVNDAHLSMLDMQDELATQGYSISYGVAGALAPHADVHQLLHIAEREMYAQKRAYHAEDVAPAHYDV